MKNLSVLFALILFGNLTLAQVESQPSNYCGYHEFSPWLQEYQQNRSSFKPVLNGSVYVPMTLHVLGTDAGAGYFPPQMLLDALCRLNLDMEQAEIQVYLASYFNYINNSAWYEHDFRNGRQMMNENNVSGTINAYIVADPAGNCGYYSPGQDALAVAKNCAGARDKTFAHELGHFLSLPHPFVGWEGESPVSGQPAPDFIGGNAVEKVDRSNCNNAGDGFCDTDPDYLSNRWNCDGNSRSPQIMTDPNGEQFQADGTLIMSYSNDQCANAFSDEQIAAMQANIFNERTELLTNIQPMAAIDPATDFNLYTPDSDKITSTEAFLEWEPVAHATHYFVQVSLLPAMNIIVSQGVVEDPFFFASGLQPGLKHYWRIRPFNFYNFCPIYSKVATFEAKSNTSSVQDIDGLASLKISPVPASAGEMLNVNFITDRNQQLQIQLVNVTGQIMTSQQAELWPGEQAIQVSTQDLFPGVYVLTLTNQYGQRMAKRVIIQ